jgi:hypothetical protein
MASTHLSINTVSDVIKVLVPLHRNVSDTVEGLLIIGIAVGRFSQLENRLRIGFPFAMLGRFLGSNNTTRHF